MERRFHQRKWKWVVHGSPRHQNLTSITPTLKDESSETSISLFFTTSAGSVFEYQVPKQLGQLSDYEKHLALSMTDTLLCDDMNTLLSLHINFNIREFQFSSLSINI